MKIIIENISKNFNNRFIFKNVTASLVSEKPVAITGANGSGKSTLLKIIAGLLTPDTGKILYQKNNIFIPDKKLYQYVAFMAPYSELIEEFTLSEMLQFNARFTNYYKNLSISAIIDMMDYEKYKNTLIKNFSSGMKQKLKIALCIFFNKPLLFFDEPCSYLDPQSKDWYKQIISEYLDNRLLIIASNNNEDEIYNCLHKLNIQNYNT